MSRTITTNHTSAESETKVTIIYIQWLKTDNSNSDTGSRGDVFLVLEHQNPSKTSEKNGLF